VVLLDARATARHHGRPQRIPVNGVPVHVSLFCSCSCSRSGRVLLLLRRTSQLDISVDATCPADTT
jgi:hypothetical protein